MEIMLVILGTVVISVIITRFMMRKPKKVTLDLKNCPNCGWTELKPEKKSDKEWEYTCYMCDRKILVRLD